MNSITHLHNEIVYTTELPQIVQNNLEMRIKAKNQCSDHPLSTSL